MKCESVLPFRPAYSWIAEDYASFDV
jgi:hypothetical protein